VKEHIVYRSQRENQWHKFYVEYEIHADRLCGLAVRVPSYRSRGLGFDSRRYQIYWEVVGLKRGPLSRVIIIEELLEWKSSGSGQENRINGQEDPLRWPRDTLYPQKLAWVDDSIQINVVFACLYLFK
jgi:hypothetical protein